MAWSIFSSSNGGNNAAVQWAKALLQAIGAPQSDANVQFVYDWEKSEGGGGKFNPLNQGPVPGHPELTTTGSQYGGGAADYASYGAGIQGAVAYLNMPNFAAVKTNLVAGNAVGARAALIRSPWAASHYGNGASFSQAPLPSGASLLTPLNTSILGDLSQGTKVTGHGQSSNGLEQFLGELVSPIFWERVMFIVGGGVLIIMGIVSIIHQSNSFEAGKLSTEGALVGAAEVAS